MYIAYDVKNGTEYAKLYTSRREGKKTHKEYVNLGRVLDRERGIYMSRDRGVFTFDIATGEYGEPDASFVPAWQGCAAKERLVLDFGDAWLMNGFMEDEGLWGALDAVGYGNPDTLRAMACYYMLASSANCHAQAWWEGSYARLLWPKANLTSQRISSFLAAVGDEARMREFFGAYLKWVSDVGGRDAASVLIDSTGLPNSIRFPLTAVSNHGGEISEEVRLVYVTQQRTGLPIYFRYCPGNVTDTTSLRTTIAELKASGVNTKFAILDAGYYDDANIEALYADKISFVTRLKANRRLYKDLVATHIPEIEVKENFVSYNGRYAYIKQVGCELVDGRAAWAYVCLDIDRKDSEARKLFRRATAKGVPDGEVYDALAGQGAFVLVSSRRIAKEKVLPTYYMRQQIEQVFDIGKNYADMLPLRVQSEETLRGHLLLTFVATVAMRLLQDKLKNTPYNPLSALMNMRNQKVKVYEKVAVPQEAFKKANDIYKLIGVACPSSIDL
jgi:hypothetical protein